MSIFDVPAGVDTHRTYYAGLHGQGLSSFETPPLAPSGMPYGGVMSDLRVYVNGVPRADYALSAPGTITFDSPLTSGDRVEIIRRTPIDQSAVVYPVPTRYTPLHGNKSITQALLAIQELWGALGAGGGGGAGGARVWSTTVSNGAQSLLIPFEFGSGLMFLGGAVYDLMAHTTVTPDGSGNSLVTLGAPVVGNHTVVTLTFD